MDIQSWGNFIVFHVRHQFDVHLLKRLTRFYIGKRIIHLSSKQFSLEFSFRFGIFVQNWNFIAVFFKFDFFHLHLWFIFIDYISLDSYILWRSWHNRSLASLVLNLRYKMDQARFEFRKDALHNICKFRFSGPVHSTSKILHGAHNNNWQFIQEVRLTILMT